MKKSLFFSLIIILLAVNSILAADFPLSYQDDLGRTIVIKKPVERIVSLAPGITETLYALGLSDKIVAVSSAADFPEQVKQKTSVGRISEPDIEKIVALEPDLVLAESLTKLSFLNRLTELGINNVGFNPESITATLTMISEIAQLCSAEKKGELLIENLAAEHQQLKKLVASKLKTKSRPRVFYQIWPDPIYTAGKDTFIDNMIFEAGGYNIGRNAGSGWPQFNMESLLTADPEVFIISDHNGSGYNLNKLRENKLLREISAFKSKRLYQVKADLVNRPSPRIVAGYKEFVLAIFPELKKEIE
ncbi:ABC transporter substrate-binding protein [Halanaerobium salsuginis]|uniref:Iron complex transport system substrate-binding protein n=1 Tax=Halanaerobium salsuginis TaxID=29563 RepID=A0A1I4GUA6_9FIRM|nr:cobalamin-binding protein [Halanaerobium salsuginis]SFL33555.1 iron complex transport system substrate-binding protein [Halanaerobium salsuginis]